MHLPQAGFEPPLARDSLLLNEKDDALANQATTAGIRCTKPRQLTICLSQKGIIHCKNPRLGCDEKHPQRRPSKNALLVNNHKVHFLENEQQF